MNIPSTRFDDALKYFTAYELRVNAPGNATVGELCKVFVPFAHYLRKATLGSSDIDAAGTLTAKLMFAAVGGARAGAQVGTTMTSAASADFPAAGNADVTLHNTFVLTTTEQGVLRAAGTMYCLQLQGTNAGDILEMPYLCIGVEPDTRSGL